MAIWLRIVIVAALLVMGSNSDAQDLVKVPVQIPAITPAVTAFAVARERGYYRQEGLDVQLVVMPSGLGTQALLGGNVRFSTAGGAGLMPILRGAPVRFMFTTFSRPMFWLYARSDIRSVESLKGKKVGVSGLGRGPDSLLREIFKKHGLDGGRNVAIMAVAQARLAFMRCRLALSMPRCSRSRQTYWPRTPASASWFRLSTKNGSSCKERLTLPSNSWRLIPC
jgi:ABC-type nitrate/sulfonate/bicarbonate transport system substrate-binding protein